MDRLLPQESDFQGHYALRIDGQEAMEIDRPGWVVLDSGADFGVYIYPVEINMAMVQVSIFFILIGPEIHFQLAAEIYFDFSEVVIGVVHPPSSNSQWLKVQGIAKTQQMLIGMVLVVTTGAGGEPQNIQKWRGRGYI